MEADGGRVPVVGVDVLLLWLLLALLLAFDNDDESLVGVVALSWIDDNDNDDDGEGGDNLCARVIHWTHKCRIGLDDNGGVILTGGTCMFKVLLVAEETEVELMVVAVVVLVLLILLLLIPVLLVILVIEVEALVALWSVFCKICCGKGWIGTVELLECK